MDLSIIAVTYGHGSNLNRFIKCCLDQDLQDWELLVMHDGSSNDSDEFTRNSAIESRNICESYNDPRIKYYESETRLNCFGHQNRAWGLSLAQGKYINFNNADNEFTKDAFSKLVKYAIEFDRDVALADLKHSYFPNIPVFKTHFAINYCDMCNFVIKADIAKEVGFIPKGSQWDRVADFAADGHFIEKVKKYYPKLKVLKIDENLFTHN